MLSAQSMIKKLLCVLCTIPTAVAWAEGEAVSEPSAFANTLACVTYYKSDLVQDKEMVSTYSYSAGVYGGELRKIGIVLDLDYGSYGFDSYGTKINSSTLDVSVRYQWSPFFAGLILSNDKLVVNAPPDSDGNGFLDQGVSARKYMDVSSRGIGAVIGGSMDIGKTTSIYTDATVVETLDLNEAYIESPDNTGVTEKKSVQIGRRTKFKIGGIFQITKKNLDLNLGYQYLQSPVRAEGANFDERRSTLFAGLRFRATF